MVVEVVVRGERVDRAAVVVRLVVRGPFPFSFPRPFPISIKLIASCFLYSPQVLRALLAMYVPQTVLKPPTSQSPFILPKRPQHQDEPGQL